MKLRLLAVMAIMAATSASLSAQKTDVDKFTKTVTTTSDVLRLGYITATIEDNLSAKEGTSGLFFTYNITDPNFFMINANSHFYLLFADGESVELTNVSFAVARKKSLFSAWRLSARVQIPLEVVEKMAKIPITAVRADVSDDAVNGRSIECNIPEKQAIKNQKAAERFVLYIDANPVESFL
ncbi:hypothetical protein [Porphyromonas gulae]|uniref:Uncharacterized protein n=1 Tax=Porphyromonas gulae TaxID=111105 RepID=A0A0A2F2K2_9PORP|nr:hypothetical protein [Porphyromonas gulae]KGN85251.1 hypothetical protein HR08_06650 [Porphyromonas gulae]